MKLGATPLPAGGFGFCVWAPTARRVELHVVAPDERLIELSPEPRGYFTTEVAGLGVGARYFYRLDGGRELPDPASRAQPAGVHGPSATVDLAFSWTDAGHRGLSLADYVTYELHIGAFSAEGTFDGVIDELPRLRDLGVTAIELMPVAQFPGERNWGYDGVFPFAVQMSYGGARGLQRVCDACHALGMACVLDVVYNHLGPEGNRLRDYGPYFTDAYHTAWGAALNFDGAGSDEVRRFFIENALQWVEDFHVDALRLDAVHAILDRSAMPFLEELADAVHAAGGRLGRRVYVIAESDRNDPRLVHASERGGYGLDATWADDFHHALHVLLTGEQSGYYADFGGLEDLATAWREGFTYAGRYSTYRQRRHGRDARDIPHERFVVCAQNHDQVGNRMLGERLGALVSSEAQKLAAACVLLSGYSPLLFMGEEYGELAPFLYFVSHGDRELVEAVRRGRKQEFRAFGWRGAPPDPQSPDTFARSRLDPALRKQPRHAQIERFYRALLVLRRELGREPVATQTDDASRVLQVWSRDLEPAGARWLVLSFASAPAPFTLAPPDGSRRAFRKRLCSSDPAFGGGGDNLPAEIAAATEVELPPLSCVVYLAQ